jgi:hypothetical protein
MEVAVSGGCVKKGFLEEVVWRRDLCNARLSRLPTTALLRLPCALQLHLLLQK